MMSIPWCKAILAKKLLQKIDHFQHAGRVQTYGSIPQLADR